MMVQVSGDYRNCHAIATKRVEFEGQREIVVVLNASQKPLPRVYRICQ